MSDAFWNSRRVLLTGHTGFKGAWLSLWLQQLGAEVIGVSLDPPSSPNLFEVTNAAAGMLDLRMDVRDDAAIAGVFTEVKPDVVFHLAAQALVRPSYEAPLETFSTNIMGTANVLEAVRHCPSVAAAVIVTTDKCYENLERHHAYLEDERLGGHDPYSSSKACAEIVTSAYRRSFLGAGRAATATVRAGNVIGGGDWARDRLLPDLMRAFTAGTTARIRSPQAVRPWQHVLEPLSACMALAERLASGGQDYAEAWNVGPEAAGCRTVGEVVQLAAAAWGEGAACVIDRAPQLHEATLLQLDAAKARARLGWTSRWSLEESVRQTVRWYKGFATGEDMRTMTLAQIREYSESISE